MIVLNDIWTASNMAYEEIAMLQLDIAKRSRISGDVNIFNKKQMQSTELYAYLDAVGNIDFNHSIENNKIIERVYHKIKLITKDLRQWD
jgi:hypothetical protein